MVVMVVATTYQPENLQMIDDLVAYAQIASWPLQPDIVFWLAVLLILGDSLGKLVYRKADLPRIVGYSAVGMVIALAGHGRVSTT